ncbi:hypothetical protein L6164_032511 [Bauhinia variegata]|uniref:Uncharacterized protein n=1 Tax=Bauhinia variegata TaxID=167791 RepID=A0ACB9KPB0_BAUVA|nr:hypothetical protein L6164_032511 [Bauhinia variegata]
MGKRLKGNRQFRQRLLLAALSSNPILIEDIRTGETWPGLQKYEVSFLRLLEMIVLCKSMKLYKPGTVMGGKHLVHDCGVNRSIGYFLEPRNPSALGSKESQMIRFGVPSEGLDLKIDSRGVPPNGGGEVVLSVPIVKSLMAKDTLLDLPLLTASYSLRIPFSIVKFLEGNQYYQDMEI